MVAIVAAVSQRKAFQIRVIDAELGVVLLQDEHGGSLDGESADGVRLWGAVRGSHDFDMELRR